MAILEPTVHSINTLAGPDTISGQLGEVIQITFYLTGTYADADGIQITGVPAALASARKDNRTYTLVDAMRSHIPATKNATANTMSLTAVTVSTNDITATVTDGDESTALADAAVPAQGVPFSVLAVVR